MFYQNLIRLCTERGTTPTEVCHSIGLAGSAATKWKSGATPRDTTLKKIADYFGVTVDDLISLKADIRVDLQLFAADPVDNKEKEPTVTVDPKLLSLIDSMNAEELADLEKYAEFILTRKKGD